MTSLRNMLIADTALRHHREVSNRVIDDPIQLLNKINWDTITVFGSIPIECPKGEDPGVFRSAVRYPDFPAYEQSEYGWGGFQLAYRNRIDVLNEESPQTDALLRNYWGALCGGRLSHHFGEDKHQLIEFVAKVKDQLPSLRFISVHQRHDRNWRVDPYREWHTSNNAYGSGLDADLLDGHHHGGWANTYTISSRGGGLTRGLSSTKPKYEIWDEWTELDYFPPPRKAPQMTTYFIGVPKFWFATEADAIVFRTMNLEWMGDKID